MAILAIEGHVIRGKEVIEILEMLGGKKEFVVNGNTSSKYRYYIDSDKMINVFTVGNEDLKYEYITFTLEEFLEKFPYKVGDKVKYMNNVFHIKSSQWDSEKNTMIYYIDADWSAGYVVETSNLQPYKEETMKDYLVTEEDYGKTPEVEQEYMNAAERLMDQLAEGTHWKCKEFDSQKMIALFLKKNTSIITEKEDSIIVDIPKGYEFAGVDDDKQQVVFEKIGHQYPKTYEECCKILNYIPNSYDADEILVYGYMCDELRILQKLLVCRDAYWKIAGEEMGLGKPWEPKWEIDNVKYSILIVENETRNGDNEEIQRLLVFPTEEMRDAFSDSKEIAQLIEDCKEFL